MREEEIKKEKAIDEDPLWVKPGYEEKDVSENNLSELSDLDDYEVEKNDQDVRGWKIALATEKLEGRIDELIVDPQKMKARYIVASFENVPEKGDRKRILIPIGQANLDEKEKMVYLPKVHLKTILLIPAYDKKNFNREYEKALRKILSDPAEYQERPMSEFYEHDNFDKWNFYSHRRANRFGLGGSKFKRK